MLARAAMELVFDAFPDDACFVCANGYVSRDVFNLCDREQHFYMLGSMGLGASIAFGAALARPERTIVALDGDGNLLMGLGALTMIGSQQPENLYHVCIDNGVYASTGNQPTVAPRVSLEGIAREAGYRWSASTSTPDETRAALKTMLSQPGPCFLRIRVETQAHPREFARVSHTCEEIHARFARALRGEAGA